MRLFPQFIAFILTSPLSLTWRKRQVPWEPQVLREVQAASPWVGGSPRSNRHVPRSFLTCFSLVSTVVSRPARCRAHSCYHLDPLGRGGTEPPRSGSAWPKTPTWASTRQPVALAVAGDPWRAGPPARSTTRQAARGRSRLRFGGQRVQPGSALAPSQVVLLGVPSA